MNKIFNKNIFNNTIKDLFLITLLMAILSTAVTVLLITSGFNGGLYTRYFYFNIPYYRGAPTAIAIAPILILFMFLGAPAITFMAFKHQNNRVLSDKYHSLPFTRNQQFVSRIISVLLMVYAVIFVTVLSALISLAASGVPFTMSYVVFNLLGYIAGSTLLVGITALAMSFTGNIFANITVTALILFLPRCILMSMAILVNGTAPNFVNIGTLNMFYNPIMNIPVGMVLDQARLWEYFGMSETLINPASIIYTVVLGLIYIGFALLISQKRKSELAEKSFINPWQSVIAAGLCAMPLMIVACYNALTGIYAITFDKSIILFLAFALFIQMLLIIIYNAGFRHMVKGAIAFVLITAMALGFGLAGNAIGKSIAYTKVDAGKVDYIKMDLSYEKYYRNNPTYMYGELLFRDIKITDDNVMNAMTNSLNSYVDFREELDAKCEEENNMLVWYDSIWCEYHMDNGKTITRQVSISDVDDYNVIIDFIMAQDVLRKLPPVDDTTDFIDAGEFRSYGYYDCRGVQFENPYEEISRQIYSSYYDELSGYRNLNKDYIKGEMGSLRTSYRYDYQFAYTDISIGGDIDNVAYQDYYPIGKSTPYTAQMYMKAINEEFGKTIKDDMQLILDKSEDIMSYSVDGCIVSGNESADDYSNYNRYSFYNVYMNEENQEMLPGEYLDEICQLVIDADFDSISCDTSYLTLRVDMYTNPMTEEDYSYYRPYIYVPVTDTQYEYWAAVIKEINPRY